MLLKHGVCRFGTISYLLWRFSCECHPRFSSLMSLWYNKRMWNGMSGTRIAIYELTCELKLPPPQKVETVSLPNWCLLGIGRIGIVLSFMSPGSISEDFPFLLIVLAIKTDQYSMDNDYLLGWHWWQIPSLWEMLTLQRHLIAMEGWNNSGKTDGILSLIRRFILFAFVSFRQYASHWLCNLLVY